MIAPNNSFNPNPLRSTNNMADKACHVVGYTTRVGLTKALGRYDTEFGKLLESTIGGVHWHRAGVCCGIFHGDSGQSNRVSKKPGQSGKKNGRTERRKKG